VLALAIGGATLGLAGPASAQEAPPGPPIPYPRCETTDYDLPEGVSLIFCVEIHLGPGHVKFGSVESDVAAPATIRQVVGLGPNFTIVPITEDGAPGAPSFPTIEVPGGIFAGIPLLQDLQLGSLTGVSANIVPVGPLTTSEINIGSLFSGVGPLTTANLPFVVKVNNLLLGNTCFIGTPAAPINLNLALELTEQLYTDELGIVSALTGSDTSFAIPAADGCGPLGVGGLLSKLKLQAVNVFNGLVNSQVGLPSPSGNNHLTFGDGRLAITADNADFPG
jgi:hypothetical protein